MSHDGGSEEREAELASDPTDGFVVGDTLLFLCVAIAARALFEGMGPLIFTVHARRFRNLIMGGGSNIEGESLACQLHFQSAHKTEKNASAQGSLEFRDVSNSFWEGTRR